MTVDFTTYNHIPALILDLYNGCNLKCGFCPSSQVTRNEYGGLSLKQVKEIFEDLRNHRITVGCLLPFWNGEALMNPDFIQFLRLSKTCQDFVGDMNLHTNGTLLNSNISAEIISTEMFRTITISLDAADSDIYSKVRPGFSYSVLIENIENFIRFRQEHNYIYPKLIFQFVVCPENYFQVRDFQNLWLEKFENLKPAPQTIFDDCGLKFDRDYIFFRRWIPFQRQSEFKRADLLHCNAMKELGFVSRPISSNVFIESGEEPRDESRLRPPCPGIFKHIGVNFRGDVSACCEDYQARINLGNISRVPVSAILKSVRFLDYRLAHLSGNFDRVPRCSACSNQMFGTLPDDFAEIFLNAHQLDQEQLK